MNLRKLISLSFLIFLVNFNTQGQVGPAVKQGQLDLSRYDFADESPVPINGEWEFYWSELLGPSEQADSKQFGFLPQPWSISKGVATYRVRVLLNPNFANYSLEVPQMYSAYALWANGTLIASNGTIGSSRKTMTSQWLPKLVPLAITNDTLDLSLQVANFTHSTGGLKTPIVLGLTSDLSTARAFAETVNIVLLCFLGLFGVLGVGIYFFLKKEKAILYFALMCLVWAVRSVSSELYLLVQWYPGIDWELLVKIEYLTIFLEVCFASLLLSKLYPGDTQKFILKPIQYISCLFVFFCMATPAVVYTQFLNLYLAVAGFTILYAIFVIIRAIVYDRYGARFSVLGIISGAGAFGYNMLSFLGLFEFNPAIYYSCYIISFACIGIAVGYQLSPKAASRNIKEKLTLEDFMAGS